MKIQNGYPPNYIEITKHLTPDKNTIYCYGDTIYNPNGKTITPDLEKHEEVHMKQQGKFPDIWWNKYLTDNDFRLQEEIEAYGEQYKYLRDILQVKGNLLQWFLDNMATALSGNVYGSLLSFTEAQSKIRNYGKQRVL